MKNLRRLCGAVVFTLALTIPAFAGDIQTTVTSPPPSQPSQTATLNGDIQTGVTGQVETGSSEATASGSATEITLNLLMSVLALF
jgi:FlaG/FlaF family flagellin (archaellin)